jgi:hypothetical protein
MYNNALNEDFVMYQNYTGYTYLLKLNAKSEIHLLNLYCRHTSKYGNWELKYGNWELRK